MQTQPFKTSCTGVFWHMPKPILFRTLWSMALIFSHAVSFSQTDTARHLRTIDKVYTDPGSRTELAGVNGNDTTIRILESLQARALRMQELRSILENRLDTNDMKESLPRFMGMADMLIENTKGNSGKLNFRYLMGLETLMNTMQDNADAYGKMVSGQLKHLEDAHASLGRVGHDSMMDLQVGDPMAVRELSKEVRALDSSAGELMGNYNQQKVELAKYQTMIGELRIKLLELKNLIQAEKRNVQGAIWNKEINYAWEPNTSSRGDWRQKLALSNGLNAKIITDYISKNMSLSIWMVICTIAIGFLSYWFLRRSARAHAGGGILRSRVPMTDRYPFLTSILFMIPVCYFVYADMPLVFIALLTAIIALVSLPLVRLLEGRKPGILLFAGIPTFLCFYYTRLNWETIYEFRWIILLAALMGAALGFLFLRTTRYSTSVPKIWRWLAGFLLVMSACSVLGNLFGRYNLAKVCGASGVIGFYRGIGLWLIVEALLEGAYMLIEGSRAGSQPLSSVAEHRDFTNRFRLPLDLTAIAVWVYYTLVFIGYWDPLVGSLDSFLQRRHTVGDLTFNYWTIVQFLLILLASAWLAEQVAYVTAIREERSSIPRSRRIGSSVLLIRIAILTAGFFLALAATKIPLDKLTIVIGALSVGIGFGLQNIIDNLASGFILALERPIQVGDQVEVNGKSGTVKEIGIRSSRIRASDGADVVMPNSHLISNGLVNWTLKDNFKKVDMVVSVANSSDPAHAKRIMEEVLRSKDLLPHPAPQVAYHDLVNNAVQLKASFWVDDPGKAGPQRSMVIGEIVERFRDAGIKMPEKE